MTDHARRRVLSITGTRYERANALIRDYRLRCGGLKDRLDIDIELGAD